MQYFNAIFFKNTTVNLQMCSLLSSEMIYLLVSPFLLFLTRYMLNCAMKKQLGYFKRGASTTVRKRNTTIDILDTALLVGMILDMGLLT